MLVPRFCDQALYSSGVLQIRPPRSASVFLKLWGLKYGNPTAANASLKMALIAGAAPVLVFQSDCFELEIVAHHDLGCREQRIVQPSELFLSQIVNHRPNVVAHWEERGDE